MKKYIIKLEFFGKLLSTEVVAYNKEQAIQEVKNRIDIHSIVEQKEETYNEDFYDYFKDFLGL